MKKRIIFALGICSFLFQVWLNMSGYQNIYLANILLPIAGILMIAWALIPTLRSVWKEVSSLSEAKKTLGLIIVTLLIISTALTSIMAYKISLWKPPEQIQNTRQNKKLDESLKPEKIKGTVIQWLSTFNLGFTPIEDVNFDFQLVVNLLNGKRIYIGKTKQFPKYLTIQTILIIPEEYQKLLKKLQSNQLRRIARDLAIEVGRLYLESSQVYLPHQIILERRLPITNNLTEDILIKAIDEVASAEDLIKQTLLRDLEQ